MFINEDKRDNKNFKTIAAQEVLGTLRQHIYLISPRLLN